MIDIHSHVIPFVDDGSTSLEASLKLLEDSYASGVTDLICTPHFRKGVFQPTAEDIKKNFELLKMSKKTPINLYLGQEISAFNGMCKMIKSQQLFSINCKPYILLEFPYVECNNLSDFVYDALYSGYTPIIAHIERYEYVNISTVEHLKEEGALIQINADSLVSKYAKRYNKRVKQYIKNELVDFVASDIHASRQNYLLEAYSYVEKNFGKDVADDLFANNAKILI